MLRTAWLMLRRVRGEDGEQERMVKLDDESSASTVSAIAPAE